MHDMSDEATRSDQRTANKTIGALTYLVIVGLTLFPISWVHRQWGVDGLVTLLLVLGSASIVGLTLLAWREHGPRRTSETRTGR